MYNTPAVLASFDAVELLGEAYGGYTPAVGCGSCSSSG
jgi:hypothetical protein